MNSIDIKDIKNRINKIDNIRAFLNIVNRAELSSVGNALKEKAYIFALEKIELYYLLIDLIIDEKDIILKQEKYSEVPYKLYNLKMIDKDQEKTTLIFLEIEFLRDYLKNIAVYNIIVDKDRALSKITNDDNIITKEDLGDSKSFKESGISFFLNLIEVATSVSKGDIITANYLYDTSKKQLLELARIYVAVKYSCDQSVGVNGEDMKAKLDSEYYSMYLNVFYTNNLENFWNSIFNIASFYRKLGLDTARSLKFEYPKKEDVDSNKHLRFLYDNFGRRVW